MVLGISMNFIYCILNLKICAEMERALYQKIALAVEHRRFSCTSLRHEWNNGVSLYREYPNIFYSVSRQSFLSRSHY